MKFGQEIKNNFPELVRKTICNDWFIIKSENKKKGYYINTFVYSNVLIFENLSEEILFYIFMRENT